MYSIHANRGLQLSKPQLKICSYLCLFKENERDAICICKDISVVEPRR